MSLERQIERQNRKLAKAEALTERYVRMLLFQVLGDMNIDQTSEVGLTVIENYRPASHGAENFTPEAITEFLAELT